MAIECNFNEDMHEARKKFRMNILDAPLGEKDAALKHEMIPYLELLENNKLSPVSDSFVPGQLYLVHGEETCVTRRRVSYMTTILVGEFVATSPFTLKNVIALDYELPDYIDIKPSQMNYAYNYYENFVIEIDDSYNVKHVVYALDKK